MCAGHIYHVWCSSACHPDDCYIVLTKVMHNPDKVYAWSKCFSDLSLFEESSICQKYCTMLKENLGDECGMLSGLLTNYYCQTLLTFSTQNKLCPCWGIITRCKSNSTMWMNMIIISLLLIRSIQLHHLLFTHLFLCIYTCRMLGQNNSPSVICEINHALSHMKWLYIWSIHCSLSSYWNMCSTEGSMYYLMCVYNHCFENMQHTLLLLMILPYVVIVNMTLLYM